MIFWRDINFFIMPSCEAMSVLAYNLYQKRNCTKPLYNSFLLNIIYHYSILWHRNHCIFAHTHIQCMTVCLLPIPAMFLHHDECSLLV